MFEEVRGFNYQPSTGTTSLENWIYFDPALIKKELSQGKKLFPKFNTVRIWLSWDAYRRSRNNFIERLETVLSIADELGLKVILCLLNRWHDSLGYDNGGVYTENFSSPHAWSYYRPFYNEYLKDIITLHRDDARILLWDLVNEPWPYTPELPENERERELIEIEYDWLSELYRTAKETGTKIPVGFSIPGWSVTLLERIRPISDLFLVHPYFHPDKSLFYDEEERKRFRDSIQESKAYADSCGLSIIATETCWGALSDEERVENIKFTLGTLKENNIGFTAHALYYSRVADLHYEEDGFVGDPGNLAFTNKDGSIRKGHEIFNEF